MLCRNDTFSPGILCVALLYVYTLSVVAAEQRVIICSVGGSECTGWQQTTVLPGQNITVQGAVGVRPDLPVVWLPKVQAVRSSAGWQLSIERLVLADADVPAPTSSPTVPVLWPLNAFASVGTALTLKDVRLVLSSAAVFQQYLQFFRSLLGPDSAIGPTFHTDGRTFIHITEWADRSTSLQSVTLLSGACAALFQQKPALSLGLSQVLGWNTTNASSSGISGRAMLGSNVSTSSGCNVFTANNATVVPLLVQQGGISSSDMMLVLLQANTSIGWQDEVPDTHIQLQRPVALVGLVTVLTGIDFEQRANQLDVTAPHASIAFSSLVLENNPAGDVESTLIAAPFSPVATINLWSVFCFRALASKPCTRVQNVTLVISQLEMDYIGYMYSMFNSQAPGARQSTLFYAQDLMFTALDFSVGPGPNSLTIHNATSVSWRMLDTVYTTKFLVAKPRPLPATSWVDFEVSKAAPLALQVASCADLKVGLGYRTIPTRLHVLLLRASVSLGSPSSHQSYILPPPTANLTTAVDGFSTLNITEWPPAEPRATCLGSHPVVAYRTQIRGLLRDYKYSDTMPEITNPATIGADVLPSLDFAYTRNAIIVPSAQPGQLTFFNVVLRQLPQGGTPAELAEAAALPNFLPPAAWTVLLWSVNSSVTERAVSIRNSALVLPQPEYNHLLAMAKLSKAFVVELAGHPDALTFKDTSQHGSHLHVPWFEGPGILGENVTLLPDPAAQRELARLGGYWWPADYQPRLSGSGTATENDRGSPQLSMLLPAIIVPVVVVILLAGGMYALLARRHHAGQSKQQRPEARLSNVYSDEFPGPLGGVKGLDLDAAKPIHQNDLSSSGRSSHKGRQAVGSTVTSASDNMEVRLDLDQLHQAGPDSEADRQAAHDALHGRTGSRYPWQRSPAPHVDSKHGFSTVLEGVPVDATSGTMPGLWQQRPQLQASAAGTSSCSSSSRMANSSCQSMQLQQHQPQQLHNGPDHSAESSAGALGRPAAGQNMATCTAGAGVAEPAGLADSVAYGLERWRAAVSSTTLKLVERRLAGQQPSLLPVAEPSSYAVSSSGAGQASMPSSVGARGGEGSQEAVAPEQQQPQQQQVAGSRRASGASTAADGSQRASAASTAADSSDCLQLRRMLGRGSFGQVWYGVWRGISVAVKVMHLPTGSLLDQSGQSEQQGQQQGQQEGPAQTAAVPPHFAVMEAVLSSQCSHPNVVQVYTYMLTPLLTASDGNSSLTGAAAVAEGDGGSAASQMDLRAPTVVAEPGHGSTAADIAVAAAAAAAAGAAGGSAMISGWELKLVMEYCDKGTLREALDRGLLKHSGAALLHPDLVTLLARDVAAAMLHLHSEGVVHGDLKAANVMLASGGPDPEGFWEAAIGGRLTAKVADFGLAVSLGPMETHATLTARGTPTHMSPELFMTGRVSKACDTYSFAMLLYEILTGQRAFTGVPLPLLPHEVAVSGLRPGWPDHLGPGYKLLQLLAEACWAQDPENRPTFAQIFDILDHWVQGDAAYQPAWLGPSGQQAPTGQPPLSLLQQQQQRSTTVRVQVCQQHQQQDAYNPEYSRVPAQQGQQQQQQHSKLQGDGVAGAAAAAAAAGIGHGHAVPLLLATEVPVPPSRFAQHLDWSEVSFEPQPQQGTQN